MSTERAAYWEERALRYGRVDRGLPAVCAYGMPRLYNWAIDTCQRHALSALLARWRDLDILDAGCGVGRWSIELAQRANRVVGLDLSENMIALARENGRRARVDCRFTVGDVSSARLPQRFDVALAVTVLQHVVGDHEFGAAIRNLIAHLKPSGTLVLLEVAPTRLTSSCDSATFRARPLSAYRTQLANANAEIVSVRGVDAQFLRTLQLAAMRKLPLARAVVAATAPLALPLDLAAGHLFPSRCWHKVIVAKHVG